MQTNFTAEQLSDPRLAEADRILKRCVHCGLCTAVCSTYVLLGDERDSPRGRIYLMKDMFERDASAASRTTVKVTGCFLRKSSMSAFFLSTLTATITSPRSPYFLCSSS